MINASAQPAGFVDDETPLRVLITTSAPLIARALERSLERYAGPVQSQSQIIVGGEAPPGSDDFQPDVLVVAPQNWEELHRWLPLLEEPYSTLPWLVYVQLRIAGLFATRLKSVFCTLVGSGSSAEEIAAAFTALLQRESLCPPDSLLTRYAQGLTARSRGRQPLPLTPRELECGCGVSLGLSNRQLAEVLGMRPKTLKSPMQKLYRKLNPANREQLGAVFE